MTRRRSPGEGSVRQRPNGLWEASIAVGYTEAGNPRRRSVYARTKTPTADILEQRIAFASSQNARYLVLQEDITKGQRVESFELTITLEGGNPRVVKGGTIGYKRIVHLGNAPIRELLLRITQTRAEPVLTAAVY